MPPHSLLPGQAISRLLTFKNHYPLWGEPHHTVSGAILSPPPPHKTVACLCGCLLSMVKHNKKQQPGFSTLCMCFCPLPMNDSSLELQDLLSLERTLFQMYSRKGSILSQCDPWDFYTMLSIPGPAPFLSPGAHAVAHLWQKSHTSRTSEFELYMLPTILSSFQLPSQWF